MITKEEILKMIADQRKGWLTQIIKSYQDDIFDVPVFIITDRIKRDFNIEVNYQSAINTIARLKSRKAKVKNIQTPSNVSQPSQPAPKVQAIQQKQEDSKKQVVFKSEELKQKKGIVTEGF